MRYKKVSQWLDWQQRLHPRRMAFGLQRSRTVAQRLGILPAKTPAISVAGTNGKGSCVTYLESIYQTAGYRSGAYRSPHIRRYNERIHVAGKPVSDVDLCTAFEAVDRARLAGDEILLTYFEFGTLAALWLFAEHEVDVMLLEVGLGGRLDVVNIVDADISVITQIGLDHTAWLGHSRESVAFEKAGIMRAQRPTICGDRDPPFRLLDAARRKKARFLRIGSDFDWAPINETGDIMMSCPNALTLSVPALSTAQQCDNAAVACTAAVMARSMLPLSRLHIAQGISQTRLPARLEERPGPISLLFDVAHNLESCQTLVRFIRAHPVSGRDIAVFSALSDKPLREMGQLLASVFDAWYVCGLNDTPRGLTANKLRDRLSFPRDTLSTAVNCHTDPQQAFIAARSDAKQGDRIVIFGSFITVQKVLEILDE